MKRTFFIFLAAASLAGCSKLEEKLGSQQGTGASGGGGVTAASVLAGTYDAMRTPAGMDDVATYADGIGPEISQLVEWRAEGTVDIKDLGRLARERGLKVHPYTHRLDSLPPHAPDSASVLNALFDQVGVDGLFSDFTDSVVRHLAARGH